MIQNLIALIVAASVCWHTVAGCCAHHGHAASQTGEARLAHLGEVAGHCDHASHHGSALQDAHRSRSLLAVPHTAPRWWNGGCPNHCGCGLGCCVFAAPKSASSPNPQDDGGKAGFASGVEVVSIHALSRGISRRATQGAPASAGAPLRRHLMLSVMRL